MPEMKLSDALDNEIQAHEKTKQENERLTTAFHSLRQSLTVMEPEYERAKADIEELRQEMETMTNIAAERLSQFPSDGYFRQLYDIGCAILARTERGTE